MAKKKKKRIKMELTPSKKRILLAQIKKLGTALRCSEAKDLCGDYY